jgi:hypothetical protein
LEESQNWYFREPSSKLRELLNLLHLPYTAMALSFVVLGSVLSPEFHVVRLLATLLAYFLGLGIGAHALDQLEPAGTRYTSRLSHSDLAGLAVAGLLGALAVGAYYIVVLSPLLIPFIGAELFFAFAYPLPSYVAGGRFHNNLSFVFSWGFLPCLTGYFVNALTLTPPAILLGLATAAASWFEIVLSRRSRNARKRGAPRDAYEASEAGLKTLVVTVCSLTLCLALIRVL